jgi:spermidine synthase
MSGLYELPLAVIAATAVTVLKTRPDRNVDAKWVGLAVIIALALLNTLDISHVDKKNVLTFDAILIVGGMICMINRKARVYGVAMICISTLVTLEYNARPDITSYAGRSFYGVTRVIDKDGVRSFLNGSNIQGGQSQLLTKESASPLYRYHPGGLIEAITSSESWGNSRKIGIIGMGAGSMSSYQQDTQDYLYFEMDPNVISVATDASRFSFVDASDPATRIIQGNARTVLTSENSIGFDILMLDTYAFGSLPFHLLTLEAFDVLKSQLSETGFILAHISNEAYNLERPISAAAESLGMQVYLKGDDRTYGKVDPYDPAAKVMVLALPSAVPDFIDETWTRMQGDTGYLWTDNRIDVIRALKIPTWRK